MHPSKTRVVTVAAGFEFLGFHGWWDAPRGTWRKEVSRESAGRFRDRVRALTPRLRNQRKPTERSMSRKAPKLGGNPRLRQTIGELNRFLRGWHRYFRGV